MTRVMYDSVEVGTIPASADAVALYIDGHYANFKAGVEHCPHANHLSIAVFADHDAACLDVEPLDATPAQAAGWVRRQLDRGQPHPVIYSSRDNMQAVLTDLARAGIGRDQVRLWSAHYGMGPHICSPRTCGASFTADGTQWTDSALGRNLDESLLADHFFPPRPARPVRAPHKKVIGAGATAAIGTGLIAAAHAFGAHLTPAESGALASLAAIIGGYLAPPGYTRGGG